MVKAFKNWRQQKAVDYVISFYVPLRKLTRRRNAILIFPAYLICWYVWWSVIGTISIWHKVGWFWNDYGMIMEGGGGGIGFRVKLVVYIQYMRDYTGMT